MTHKIYLAGPDVFVPNYNELANQKKELCKKYGFEGLFPLDNVLDLINKSPKEAGLAIAKANEDLIRKCDIIIANLTPFRGVSADSGTIYEVGVGVTLRKIVYGYSNVVTSFYERTVQYYKQGGTETYSKITLESPLGVEKFDLPDNLMIPGGIYESKGEFIVGVCSEGQEMVYLGNFEKCLIDLKDKINQKII